MPRVKLSLASWLVQQSESLLLIILRILLQRFARISVLSTEFERSALPVLQHGPDLTEPMRAMGFAFAYYTETGM